MKQEIAARHVKDVSKDMLSPELTCGGDRFRNHRATHKEMNNVASRLVSFLRLAIHQPVPTLQDILS
jgi:hypothetical protein